MPPEQRARLWSCAPPEGDGSLACSGALRNPVLIMLASGLCLAVHFGGWVWGIAHTSLPHSLLFVSATPVLIAAGIYSLPVCDWLTRPVYALSLSVIGSAHSRYANAPQAHLGGRDRGHPPRGNGRRPPGAPEIHPLQP
eukprot:9476552-Pyramimonas_sp.AAC.1